VGEWESGLHGEREREDWRTSGSGGSLLTANRSNGIIYTTPYATSAAASAFHTLDTSCPFCALPSPHPCPSFPLTPATPMCSAGRRWRTSGAGRPPPQIVIADLCRASIPSPAESSPAACRCRCPRGASPPLACRRHRVAEWIMARHTPHEHRPQRGA
jgi:hypothetical protein